MADARAEAFRRVKDAGERVCATRAADGVTRYAVMLKKTGTVLFYSESNQDFIFDKMTFANIVEFDLYTVSSASRALENFEVTIPMRTEDLPGYAHDALLDANYGFTQAWRAYVEEKAKKIGKVLPPLSALTTAGGPSGSAVDASDANVDDNTSKAEVLGEAIKDVGIMKDHMARMSQAIELTKYTLAPCFTTSASSGAASSSSPPSTVTSAPTVAVSAPTVALGAPTVVTSAPTVATGAPTVAVSAPTVALSTPTVTPLMSTANPSSLLPVPPTTAVVVPTIVPAPAPALTASGSMDLSAIPIFAPSPTPAVTS